MSNASDLINDIESGRSEPSEMADEIIQRATEKPDWILNNDQNPVPPIDYGSHENPSPGIMTDDTGAYWSEEIHESPPRKKPNGEWAKKRGSKKGHSHSTNPQQVSVSPIDPTLEAERTAQIVAAQIFLIGQVIGGEEWQPRIDPQIGLDERALMVEAWRDYFVTYGIRKPPAWLTLGFVCFMYAAPRFAMPKTQSRFAKWKAVVSRWFGRKKNDQENV